MDYELPRGVSIREYENGLETIYITFTINGFTCKEALKNIAINKKNIRYATNLKAEVDGAITRQTFKYDDYFPDSGTRTAQMFGESRTKTTISKLFKSVVWEDLVPKRTTAHTYRKDAKWADKALGHLPVSKLTVRDIRDWVKSMPNIKRKTISNRLVPLRIILAMAVDDELIDVNPADAVSLGKQSKGLISRDQRKSDQSINPFTNDEIEKILRSASEYSELALNYFQTALYTGLRASELKGLKWVDKEGNNNVDFDKDILHVRSTLVSLSGKSFTQTPKTTTSFREVDLTPMAKTALERQKKITFGKSEYVFTLLDGGEGALTNNSDYSKPWTTILSMVDVDYRPAKQTRHTYASQMLSGGENPAYIAGQLGHVDLEMIYKYYAKWINNNEEAKHIFTSGFGQ